MRAWLFLFLSVAVLLAAGALTVRHKLETLKTFVLDTAATVTGAEFDAKAVSVSGLRGLRFEESSLRWASAQGNSIHVTCPVAYARFGVLELLRSRPVLGEIELEQAIFCIESGEERSWLDLERLGGARGLPADWAFRVSGKECRVEWRGLPGKASLVVEGVNLDVARSPDSSEIRGHLAGYFNEAPPKKLEMELRFSSFDDFLIRLRYDSLTAHDVKGFLPGSSLPIDSGVGEGRVQVNALPGKVLDIEANVSFEDLLIRGQPASLYPATGKLTAQARFDRTSRVLSVVSALVESDQFQGELRGKVKFAERPAVLDLRFEAGRLPVQDILNFAVAPALDPHGAFHYQQGDAATLTATLSGPFNAPLVELRFRGSGGELSFEPSDARLPGAALLLGLVEASWDSQSRTPRATVNILAGAVEEYWRGLKVEGLSGIASIEGTRVVLDPFAARITRSPFVGRASYDFLQKEGDASISGRIQGLEKTFWSDSIKNVRLGGSMAVDLKVTLAGSGLRIEGELDGSQAEVGYRWWFVKPPGIGVSARFNAEIAPRERAVLHGEVRAAQTHAIVDGTLRRPGSAWRLESSRAVFDTLDLATVGKCLRIPYLIGGGSAAEGFYEWTRVSQAEVQQGRSWVASGHCKIDDIRILARGAEDPLRAKDLSLEAEFVTGVDNTARLTLAAAQCWTPRLGGVWFVPFDIDPELRDKYPSVERTYTYSLACRAIEVPPWKGSHFAGHAYFTRGESGLSSFAVNIEQGHLQGTYTRNRAENAYRVTAEWDKVPATYFIEHLGLPEILKGTVAGQVSYTKDSDNPASLEGNGDFRIVDGQFSADFLLFEFGQQADGDTASLPPSLMFSELATGLEFNSDTVRTPNLRLVAEGVVIDAKGQFVTGGEMDYDLRASITPETAERIPLLEEALNLKGHRIAKQNVELGFKVTGPTWNPRGELAHAPPASVTLVTGGLEMVSEAVTVIDIPRKILVDLLKIGGGIVGKKKGAAAP